MEGLTLSVTSTSTSSTLFFSSFRNPISTSLRLNRLSWSRHRTSSDIKFVVLGSNNEEPRLDPLDQMELKFGSLIGEEPKLTMAKILARKANPDASYLDIEKSYYKNKGNIADMKEVPNDWSGDVKSPSSLDGLNLVRPVPKKGFEYKSNIAKPTEPKIKRPSQSVGKAVVESVKRNVPNVILRRPSVVNEPDVGDKPSRLRLRRNLSLSMRNPPAKEEFSDMTLLRKPEPMIVDEEEKNEFEVSDFTLLDKPELVAVKTELKSSNSRFEWTDISDATPNSSDESDYQLLDEKPTRLESTEPRVSNANLSVESGLIGRPKRLDPSSLKQVNPKKLVDFENLQIDSGVKELEDVTWARAETFFKNGERVVVELISCSARGFAVSYGSLVGFIPYRNLSSKWKFLAFESWLRRKGLDPALYRKSLGIIGHYETANSSYTLDQSTDSNVDDTKAGQEVSADMSVEDLLMIYDREKIKFLSSFVGQRLKVNILLANRKSRKLLFSVKPKEREEFIANKRSLMAKLQVGDVVKCCITKITYFGIFVEIDGVPALIHQTEVSWDATLDPSAYFKVGQIVEAKVHQLDFALDRIFLSLKEIMPDPLIEALESVVGNGERDPLDGRLQVAQADSEWSDVESLIKELVKIKGIKSVSKGRFFMSPGLAPTFQVYMASMFESQYKLLARSANKVQEVIVETTLNKEELKSAILTCTNRVQ